VIDFRYHIVSIVAIFLALAVGIVLGSGPLKDNISGFLEDRTKALAAEKLALQQQVTGLEGDLADAEDYAQLVKSSVIGDVLFGTSVAMVMLPGASDDARKAVESTLVEAGAVVTEEVQITQDWTDPDQAAVLAAVNEGLDRSSQGTDPYGSAADLVARALVTQQARAVGQSSPAGIGVLAAYEEAGFLRVADLEAVTWAATSVVVAGDPADMGGSDVADQVTTLLPLPAALSERGRASVVVGPAASAGPDGIVTAVRGSDLGETVSTVDSIDTTAGVTVVALALDEQKNRGVGHYGTGDGAQAVGPDLAPPGG
jgi:hypothetical protein